MLMADLVRLFTSYGATPGRYVAAAAADQDATVVKAGPGVLKSCVATNLAGAVRYVKWYDQATPPTAADAPVQVYPLVPATDGAGGCVPLPPEGLAFAAGIAFRLTAGLADGDATPVAAGEFCLSYAYQ